MKFTPIGILDEIIFDKKISFRNKLIYVYANYLYVECESRENSQSRLLKKTLLLANLNKDLFKLVEEALISTKKSIYDHLKKILQNYNHEGDNEASYIANDDLNENIILNELDFLKFALKSSLGGFMDGYIAINIQDLNLYIIKDSTSLNTYKFQDECFLNRLSRILIKNYCPFKSYITSDKKTAISIVENTTNLNKNIENGAQIEIQIKNFLKGELNNKKIYGFIAAIIASSLNHNWDIILENILVNKSYQNQEDSLLFFIVDQISWSQNNPYYLDIAQSKSEIKKIFSDFSHSVHNNMIEFREQLVQFLRRLIKATYSGVLEKILNGVINNDPKFLFCRYTECRTYEFKKESLVAIEAGLNYIIESIPNFISQLSDEEMINELRVFLEIDFEELDNLYNQFYNENSTIYKMANTRIKNLTKGIQPGFICDLRYNLINIKNKVKHLD